MAGKSTAEGSPLEQEEWEMKWEKQNKGHALSAWDSGGERVSDW